MASWPYNAREWRELRAAKLKASPRCEPCEARGRATPANTVDHRVSINRGGSPFPPLSGLMSMCASCHNAKTWARDRGEGKGVAFPGAGDDGLPIDRDHPFFRGAEGYTPSKDEGSGALDRLGARIFTKFRRGR